MDRIIRMEPPLACSSANAETTLCCRFLPYMVPSEIPFPVPHLSDLGFCRATQHVIACRQHTAARLTARLSEKQEGIHPRAVAYCTALPSVIKHVNNNR